MNTYPRVTRVSGYRSVFSSNQTKSLLCATCVQWWVWDPPPCSWRCPRGGRPNLGTWSLLHDTAHSRSQCYPSGGLSMSPAGRKTSKRRIQISLRTDSVIREFVCSHVQHRSKKIAVGSYDHLRTELVETFIFSLQKLTKQWSTGWCSTATTTWSLLYRSDFCGVKALHLFVP